MDDLAGTHTQLGGIIAFEFVVHHTVSALERQAQARREMRLHPANSPDHQSRRSAEAFRNLRGHL